MFAANRKPRPLCFGFLHSCWLRKLLLVLSMLLLWLLALAIEIVTYSAVRDDGPTDAAIVLDAVAWNGIFTGGMGGCQR